MYICLSVHQFISFLSIYTYFYTCLFTSLYFILSVPLISSLMVNHFHLWIAHKDPLCLLWWQWGAWPNALPDMFGIWNSHLCKNSIRNRNQNQTKLKTRFALRDAERGCLSHFIYHANSACVSVRECVARCLCNAESERICGANFRVLINISNTKKSATNFGRVR